MLCNTTVFMVQLMYKSKLIFSFTYLVFYGLIFSLCVILAGINAQLLCNFEYNLRARVSVYFITAIKLNNLSSRKRKHWTICTACQVHSGRLWQGCRWNEGTCQWAVNMVIASTSLCIHRHFILHSLWLISLLLFLARCKVKAMPANIRWQF